MNILPLISNKPENTKPYKDWLRSCGINNVVDEDYTQRIWERWLFKCNRFGKKTSSSELKRHFPDQTYFKQLDIYEIESRSSDINLQVLRYRDRHIQKAVSNITISEHAVKRWWQHTGTAPDIMSWIESWQGVRELVRDGKPISELYHPAALLLGDLCHSENAIIGFNIDTKELYEISSYMFRIKTVIPVDKLNERQTALWYKLKEAQE